MNRTSLYPLVDRLTRAEAEAAGISDSSAWPAGRSPEVRVLARWAGEERPPRKGEWYLSGAVVEAYRAPNDLTTAYHIAELVVTRKPEPVDIVVRKVFET